MNCEYRLVKSQLPLKFQKLENLLNAGMRLHGGGGHSFKLHMPSWPGQSEKQFPVAV